MWPFVKERPRRDFLRDLTASGKMLYRITVDALDPSAGEEGLQSLSFFASTHGDIFAAAANLRERLECTACSATKLAVGLGLLSEVMHQRHTLLAPLPELIAALSGSPDGT